MDLLTNGIESIQTGIEDWKTGTRARLLSAVRSMHAGILLLYKEALRRRSPEGSNEVLLKARVAPVRAADGRLGFVGEGTRTVDHEQIREHFKRLGINTDWARFGKINRIRNDVEHYYTTVSQDTIKALIANTFVIVRDFVAAELGGDPRELLGADTWQTMLEVTDVYAAERAECERLLRGIDWDSPLLDQAILAFTCSHCGSGLLRPSRNGGRFMDFDEVHLECRACGASMDPNEFIPGAVAEALAGEMYAVHEGREIPYVRCPECGLETYIVEENRCGRCGYSAERICSRCGNPIPPNELDSAPLCSWCAHMISSDD